MCIRDSLLGNVVGRKGNVLMGPSRAQAPIIAAYRARGGGAGLSSRMAITRSMKRATLWRETRVERRSQVVNLSLIHI